MPPITWHPPYSKLGPGAFCPGFFFGMIRQLMDYYGIESEAFGLAFHDPDTAMTQETLNAFVESLQQ